MDDSFLQRLAFAKYLYSLAVEQLKAPEPMAAASLLTFHDSIELFLQVSSEHLDVNINGLSFMDYWKELSPKLQPGGLPHKQSMSRLNKARVSLKHNGTLPSKLDIESFRAITESFLQEATMLVFKMEFNDISLIEYVSPEESRNHLKKAEELCKDEKYDDATIEIALAFHIMIDNYMSDKHGFNKRYPFYFGKNMTFLDSFSMGIRKNDFPELVKFIDAVKDTIQAMQHTLKILALGLDYKKYSNFNLRLPVVNRAASGRYLTDMREDLSAPDRKYIEFCINYVIESAIKLNEFNYQVDL